MGGRTRQGSRAALAAVALLACAPGCGPEQVAGGGLLLDELRIEAVEPSTWLLGTRVVVRGQGFIPPDIGGMTATVVGSAGADEVGFKVDLAHEAGDRASFVVSPGVLAFLPVDGEPLSGTLTVERHGDRGVSGRADVPIQVRVVSSIVPSLTSVGPGQAWPGEEMVVDGEGFLLPGEGVTVLSLAGQWTRQGAIGAEAVSGVQVPLDVRGRDRATFVLSPDIAFGPGSFEGSAAVTNFHASGGPVATGTPLSPVTFSLELPYVDSVAPPVVRRGQELAFGGRGFLPVDGGLGTATFVAFTGVATRPGGSTTTHGTADPLVLVPDHVTGNHLASLVLRVSEGLGGKGVGLGIDRVTLEGTFTPHVIAGGRVLVGRGLDATLSVERQLQVVYLRFLPTFRSGVEAFGLAEVADAVRERVLAVCGEDYLPWSVEFRLDRPEDFVDYTTVEIMGSDPNGAGLLGLDNTSGKDVGNLRFDDLLGGYNAESEEAGYHPYGGVFVRSFLGFSAALAEDAGPAAAEMASTEFDAIFGPFAPALGGTPATGASDVRAAALAEAVRVLGNLIGDTVSHEVGHSLGLAAFAGDWHDPGDTPGSIMDAGAFRPFAERAGLPGAPRRHFVEEDAAYLDEVLPKE